MHISKQLVLIYFTYVCTLMFGCLTTLFTLVIFMALNYMKDEREVEKIEKGINKERVYVCELVRERTASKRKRKEGEVIIIIIININCWAIWPVPSPELQLLSPTFLRSPDCSLSLWIIVVCFERDSVVWHSLQV